MLFFKKKKKVKIVKVKGLAFVGPGFSFKNFLKLIKILCNGNVKKLFLS